MHKLVFRFDIDTHKCIRDGVPNLVRIAKDNNVTFTFFLNLGKAVSLGESIKNILCSEHSEAEMMTAREKLGIADYLYAALINPALYHYKKQIICLLKSNCEVGIHGGRNHALWGSYADKWDTTKVINEIDWAITKFRKIDSSYQPQGFASPEWNTPINVEEILKKKNFKYYADKRCDKEMEVIDKAGLIPRVGVNLLGEPGGVAFFENCRVRGMSTSGIISTVLRYAREYPYTVLYDHPYYAGVKELSTIKDIIVQAKSENIEIVTLSDII